MEKYEKEYYEKMTTAEEMLFDRFRKKESLNGHWHYAVDQYDTCLRQKWFQETYYDSNGNTLPVDFSFDEWELMTLPCCWNMADDMYRLYEGSMVYTRKFHYTRQQDDERVILKIGAANYLCHVFINRQYVGMHRGGSTPGSFDITDFLAEDNRFILQVNNTRKNYQVPALDTDWFSYGGIYRDIDLFRVPDTHIRDFKIALEPDSGFGKIRANVSVSNSYTGNAVLTIKELNISQDISVKNGIGEVILSASPELWSPENPKLYEVSLTCARDQVQDLVGFREIRVNGTEIILNEKTIFLRGISCHEESKVNGKALTDE